MSVIENFAVLPIEEQRTFAEALVNTLNSKSLFTDETDFKVTSIWADEHTGNLEIEAETTGTITLKRKAQWEAGDADDADSEEIWYLEYDNAGYEDAQTALKAGSVIVDGYKVSIEVVDTTHEETLDVYLDSVTEDDRGIGSYEYWGEIGYDSRPYVEVMGIREEAHTCGVNFVVEPAGADI